MSQNLTSPIPQEVMSDICPGHGFDHRDTLVVFGELFDRGYVNGLVDEAERAGMRVIHATVGRRDSSGTLRPLTTDELLAKAKPLINVPLEAGFDLEVGPSGQAPVDQLQGYKMSEWLHVQLDWDEIAACRKVALQNFRARVQVYLDELKTYISESRHVVFAHTMAGGVPRAKIMMPVLNRVFKGFGDRFASSEEFWTSQLGRLCEANFSDVTAQTFHHLIELTSDIRQSIEARGGQVSYIAYGYHGTPIFFGGRYQWQSYSPYLQGFAKLELEQISRTAFQNGIRSSVFNAPEILTNSSSIFLGVEVPLYALLAALGNEDPDSPITQSLFAVAKQKFKEKRGLDTALASIEEYFQSDIIQRWSKFHLWPQHNGPEQMQLMRETSQAIIQAHKDEKDLLTSQLSEVVFRSCGQLMLNEAFQPRQPVWWIGHEAVAKATLSTQSSQAT